MNRPLLFDSPFLLGFEHTRALIDRAAKAAGEGYPPYNVEDLGGGRVRITLAVAGFTAEQLEVTVEDDPLIVVGRRDGEGRDRPAAQPAGAPPGPTPAVEERAWLHRGIAARGFVRTFVLASGIEVRGAELGHGLLSIDLHRPEPQSRARRISIAAAP